jgi:3-carboxy-cis,cis-muconate cycloisomerase
VASTVLDSVLFRDAFGTPAMRGIFEDAALLSRYTEGEVALARAQGRLGVIPAAAAKDIAARCDPTKLDLERLKKETEVVGYPILPLVRQVAAQCGDAGKFLH